MNAASWLITDAIRRDDAAEVASIVAQRVHRSAHWDQGEAHPIDQALSQQHEKTAFMLLRTGVVDRREGAAPILHDATWSPALTRELLMMGHDAAAPHPYFGCSAVFDCAMKGHPETLQLLVANGSDINTRAYCEDWSTPALLVAAEYRRVEMVERLLALGADVHARQTGDYHPPGLASPGGTALADGASALHAAARAITVAADKDRHSGVDNFRMTVDLLVDAGLSIDSTDSRGRTPLHVAARSGNKAFVDVLLRAGANPDLVDLQGKRPVDHVPSTAGDARHLLMHWKDLKAAEQAKKVLQALMARAAKSPTPVLERALQQRHARMR